MKLSKLATVFAYFALESCSTVPQQTTPPWQVEPLLSVRDGAGSAEAWYQLGRQELSRGHFGTAETALRKAIAQESHHGAAHSALGVLLARRGDLDGAVGAFKEAAAARTVAPGVFNNLGYALYLQGQYEESVHALKKAATLDPGNGRVWYNLGLAEEKAGQAEKARLAFAHAEELAGIARKARNGMNVREAPEEGKSLVSTIVELMPGIFELRGPAESHAAGNASGYRLEIANGNGVPGLAKRVGDRLVAEGLPRARLENQKPYVQPVTVIQYREGYVSAAGRVGKHLPGLARLRPMEEGGKADVRLVLGHDLKNPQKQAAIIDGKRAEAATGKHPG